MAKKKVELNLPQPPPRILWELSGDIEAELQYLRVQMNLQPPRGKMGVTATAMINKSIANLKRLQHNSKVISYIEDQFKLPIEERKEIPGSPIIDKYKKKVRTAVFDAFFKYFPREDMCDELTNEVVKGAEKKYGTNFSKVNTRIEYEVKKTIGEVMAASEEYGITDFGVVSEEAAKSRAEETIKTLLENPAKWNIDEQVEKILSAQTIDPDIIDKIINGVPESSTPIVRKGLTGMHMIDEDEEAGEIIARLQEREETPKPPPPPTKKQALPKKRRVKGKRKASPPAPKAFQIAAINNLISRLTDIDPQTVDVEALVDSSISLEENWNEIKRKLGITRELTEREEEERLCLGAIETCERHNDLNACEYACEICEDAESCEVYRTLQEVKGERPAVKEPYPREIPKLTSGIFKGKNPLRCSICKRGVIEESPGVYECMEHGPLDFVYDLRRIDIDKTARDDFRKHYYGELTDAHQAGFTTCRAYYESLPGKEGEEGFKQFYKLAVALEEYFVKEQPIETSDQEKTEEWKPRYQRGLEPSEVQTEFEAGKTRKGELAVKKKKKAPRLGAGKEQKGFEKFGGEKVPEAGQAQLGKKKETEQDIEKIRTDLLNAFNAFDYIMYENIKKSITDVSRPALKETIERIEEHPTFGMSRKGRQLPRPEGRSLR